MKEIVNIISVGVTLISPLVILVIIWSLVAKYLRKRRRIKLPKEIHVAPKQIARRVIYKEELNNLIAVKGDVAYVIKDEHMYLYNGNKWLKIEQHGTMGN